MGGVLGVSPAPHPLANLLCVVARAGSQVSGIGVVLVRCLRLVEAPIGVGVVIRDLSGIDEPIGVLLDLCRSRARAASLVGQGILVRVLARISVQHSAEVCRAITAVLIPSLFVPNRSIDEELEELI